MTGHEALALCEEAGVSVATTDRGTLAVTPRSKVTAELKAALTENKSEIISALSGADADDEEPTAPAEAGSPTKRRRRRKPAAIRQEPAAEGPATGQCPEHPASDGALFITDLRDGRQLWYCSMAGGHHFHLPLDAEAQQLSAPPRNPFSGEDWDPAPGGGWVRRDNADALRGAMVASMGRAGSDGMAAYRPPPFDEGGKGPA